MNLKRKNVFLILLVIGLTIVTGISAAFAAGSINPGDLEPTVVVSDTPTGGSGTTVISDADTSRYSNDEVKNIVTQVNSGADVSPADVIDSVSQPETKQDTETFPTTDGQAVNLNLYDFVTDFQDLGLQSGDSISLEGTPGSVTITVPQTAGMDGEDLMIMQIHPVTGEIFLIALDAFDSETGTLTATFANYGPFAVISKVPLVDRECDPDNYPDQEVAEIVKSVSSTEYLSFKEWMKAQGIEDSTFSFEVPDNGDTTETGSADDNVVYAAEVQKTKTITVNVNDYEAATLLSDVAVRLGIQEFGYNMNTKIKANLYQDLDRANWTRILKYAGVQYNLKEIQKNPQLLADIEPFVLKDSFVYHIDASTGEVSIVYEPTISFDTYDEEIGESVEMQSNQDQDDNSTSSSDTANTTTESNGTNSVAKENNTSGMQVVDKSKITWFNCDDIDEENTANLNMVISGDGYLGLGPFLLLIPKTAGSDVASLWWLWLIIALIVVAVVVVVVKNRKNNA